jgi:hypothetical protein
VKTEDVLMVRVYLTEREGVRPLLRWLHDEAGVRGVTELRGVAGFGRSGEVHTAALVDAPGDLPVVLEFFESPGKARTVVEALCARVDPGHIVTWPAQICRGP